MHVLEYDILKCSYVTIFLLMSTLAALAYSDMVKERDKLKKYLIYRNCIILGGVVILTYIIDLIFDQLIGTAKIIYWAIVLTIASICVYFYKLKY